MHSDELTIKKGDVLTVVTRSKPEAPKGWVKCMFGDKQGLVPGSYIEPI